MNDLSSRTSVSSRRKFIAAAVGSLCSLRVAAAGSEAPLGVAIGNDPFALPRFEQWFGCRVAQGLVFTDSRSWEGIADPRWFVERFAHLERPLIWSVAVVPRGATLQAAASGRHDGAYRSAAQKLAAARPHADGTIPIRIGWEFNGDWFPWAAEGNETAFITTFRNVVASFREVSDRFRFEWNLNYGRTMDPLKAFPGTDVVDVVGMDFYWMPRYIGNDPDAAFARIRDDRYGLRYLDTLAKRLDKQIAFSEWGVTGNRAAPFIRHVAEWIRARDVAYHNYWDSDAAYEGKLSNGQWPDSGAAFQKAFCRR